MTTSDIDLCPPADTPAGAPVRTVPAPVRLDTAGWFDARDEIEIAHQDHVYRLRRTRAGKLILTK